MRVLVVSHYFWPEAFRINQVVEDLIAVGAQVTVLTGHPSYPEGRAYPGYKPWRVVREQHSSGCTVLRIPVITRGDGGGLRLALNYLSFVVTGILLAPWMLRGRAFDVQFVYCTTPVIQGYVSAGIKLLRGTPIVLWIQDIWPDALAATGHVRSRLLLRLLGRAVDALYRRCDLILGQSHSFVEMITPHAGRVPVVYFPNPGEHAPPPAELVQVAALDRHFDVVFGGNIGRAQAMATVLASAELLRNDLGIRLVLYGSGSMAEWMRSEIVRRRLHNIVLPGRVPPDRMAAIFRQASALLLPLVDDPAVAQTIPSKLQSYFAAGRPVIAAVNGEAARIVAGAGAGLPCAAEDPAALAAAIRALHATDETSREAMGRRARAFFDSEYEPRRLAVALLEHFGRVAAPHR